MHDYGVPLLAHPLEQRPHPSVTYTHFQGSFPLGQATLRHSFQPIQFISFLLAHRDSFHPLALRLSRGTFYLAQSGTFHLAATRPDQESLRHFMSDRMRSYAQGESSGGFFHSE